MSAALELSCSSPKYHPLAKMGMVHPLGGALGSSFRLVTLPRLHAGYSKVADYNRLLAGFNGTTKVVSARNCLIPVKTRK